MPDVIFHPLGGRQLNFCSQQISEALLQGAYCQKREVCFRAEVCEQVDIGLAGCLITSDGAEEAQVGKARSLKIRSVLAKGREDLIAGHLCASL